MQEACTGGSGGRNARTRAGEALVACCLFVLGASAATAQAQVVAPCNLLRVPDGERHQPRYPGSAQAVADRAAGGACARPDRLPPGRRHVRARRRRGDHRHGRHPRPSPRSYGPQSAGAAVDDQHRNGLLDPVRRPRPDLQGPRHPAHRRRRREPFHGGRRPHRAGRARPHLPEQHLPRRGRRSARRRCRFDGRVRPAPQPYP